MCMMKSVVLSFIHWSTHPFRFLSATSLYQLLCSLFPLFSLSLSHYFSLFLSFFLTFIIYLFYDYFRLHSRLSPSNIIKFIGLIASDKLLIENSVRP